MLISKKDCIVDGVEPDSGDFKEAKRRLRNVYQLNIETDDLTPINDRYDYVYFGDVIEHLVHPVESLKRVTDLLKPTGKLVFSIPNMSHISVRLMLLNGDLIYGRTGLLDVTHLHFYTHQEVQRVFSEAGYVITDLNPVLIDYPSELMSKELERAGLSVTDEFINIAAKTEASVYQFVGMAEPAGKKKLKSSQLSLVSPVDKFQIYLNETKKYYEDIVKADKAHIAKQDKLLHDLTSRLDETNEKLHEALHHPLRNLAKRKKQ